MVLRRFWGAQDREGRRKLSIPGVNMLKLNKSIRLTAEDIELLCETTGFQPIDIRNLDELRRFLDQARAQFPGGSACDLLQRRVIDAAITRYCG